MNGKVQKLRLPIFHTSNIITITLCIISIGILIATFLNTYFTNKYQEENIKDINKMLIQISSDSEFTSDETLEDIYMSYYNAIDQKATDSINIALSFFGFIFSLITIVNTIVAIRMPKQFEDSLIKIDERIKRVEINARESTNAVRFVDSVSSKKTTREKIDAITSVIEDYGDNSGEFFFARGFLYDDIKDYDSAKADYIRAKKAGGSEATYYNSMGVLYANIMTSTVNIKEKRKAFKKSEQYYKKAIIQLEKFDEKSDYCHCNLACLYQDYAKTIKGLTVLENMNIGFTFNEEDAQAFQRFTQLALDEFDIAISISEDYLTAYLNRGISYREMGEDFYINAYDDFEKCYKIDPENKDVLELLAKTALSLFQKTNDKKYYDVAKVSIKKLREDIDTIELLNRKFNAIKAPFVINKLLAAIDERIADLTLEEATEYSEVPDEYGNRISEALEHYKSSLGMYKQLYADGKNKEYCEDIKRLEEKISRIENPENK